MVQSLKPDRLMSAGIIKNLFFTAANSGQHTCHQIHISSNSINFNMLRIISKARLQSENKNQALFSRIFKYFSANSRHFFPLMAAGQRTFPGGETFEADLPGRGETTAELLCAGRARDRGIIQRVRGGPDKKSGREESPGRFQVCRGWRVLPFTSAGPSCGWPRIHRP